LLFWEPRPDDPAKWQWWIVRAATCHTIVHVGVALVRRRALLVEADFPAVSVSRLRNRLPVWWLSLEDYRKGWTAEDTVDLLDHVGTPYGYVDAVRQYLGEEPQDDAMTCIELACEAIRLGGASVHMLRNLMPEPLMHEVAQRAGTEPVLITE
jgi:hypothetical protein